MVVAVSGGGPGNRNDSVHYRDSIVQTMCRQHGEVLADGGYHAIARLKDWRVLRDHRRRGKSMLETIRAIAFLHNLRLGVPELRDIS